MATDEIRVKIEPVLTAKFQALLGAATEETLEKVDAGAQLVYALYHLPVDTVRTMLDLAPPNFARASARAQAAYGVGHRRPRERAEPVESSESTDPVRYTED